MSAYEPFEVWMFDDPATDNCWMVFVVDHIDYNVVRGIVLASSDYFTDEVGSWLGFQYDSYFDRCSVRIT